MELDRHFIERNDFQAVRRGYDPDEVDRHLAEIAEAVNELKRQAKRSPSSLAAQAAEQVRGIVGPQGVLHAIDPVGGETGTGVFRS